MNQTNAKQISQNANSCKSNVDKDNTFIISCQHIQYPSDETIISSKQTITEKKDNNKLSFISFLVFENSCQNFSSKSISLDIKKVIDVNVNHIIAAIIQKRFSPNNKSSHVPDRT